MSKKNWPYRWDLLLRYRLIEVIAEEYGMKRSVLALRTRGPFVLDS